MIHRLAFTALVPLMLCACGTTTGPSSGYGQGSGPPPRERPPAVMVNPDTPAQPDPNARSVTFMCDDTTQVMLTEGHRTAQATANSGTTMTLARQPDAPGSLRFGSPQYEFRARGGDATLFSQGRLWRCRVK